MSRKVVVLVAILITCGAIALFARSRWQGSASVVRQESRHVELSTRRDVKAPPAASGARSAEPASPDVNALEGPTEAGFTGRIEWADGVAREGAIRGEVWVCDESVAPVRGASGVPSYTSFSVDARGRVLGPTAMQGEPREVVDGRWTMDVPVSPLVVARVEHQGESLHIAAGHRIEPGSTHSVVRVEPRRRVSVSVVDQASGEPKVGFVFALVPRMPRGVTVELVTEGGRIMAPAKKVPTDRRGSPEPPEERPRIRKEGVSTIDLPAFDAPQELWVGAEGYQWESVDVGPDSPDLVVPIRRAGTVELSFVAPDWSQRGLGLTVVRGSVVLAEWRGLDRGRIYTLERTGAGDCTARLTWNGMHEHRVLASERVRVEPGETIRVHLEAERRSETGALEVAVRSSGNASDVDGLRLLVAPASDGVYGLASADAIRLVQAGSIDGGRLAAIKNLTPGEYAVALHPVDAIQVVPVRAGEATRVRFEVDGIATLNLWPDLTDLSVEQTRDVEALRLSWNRIGGLDSWRLTPLHSSSKASLSSAGCWSFQAVSGTYVVALFDRENRLWYEEQIELTSGVLDVALPTTFDPKEAITVQVAGLDLAELGRVAAEFALGLDADRRVRPFHSTFADEPDGSFVAEFLFTPQLSEGDLQFDLLPPEFGLAPIAGSQLPTSAAGLDGAVLQMTR